MAWENYFLDVEEGASFIQRYVSSCPSLLVVLSGGLDAFANALTKTVVLRSSDVPHFPKSKAEGHAGQILFGQYKNVPVALLQGRSHFYEGLAPQQVVFPYFVFARLGVKILLTTNAVGGIRKDLKAGDLVMVTDHINAMGTNPLMGLAVQRPSDQFPSLQDCYDPALIQLAEKIAKHKKTPLKKGVYLANPGPSYETRAEIRAYRQWGADTVGMSTVFEVIAARFLNMRVATFNIIANEAADRHTGVMNHREVLQAVRSVQPRLVRLLQEMVVHLGSEKS